MSLPNPIFKGALLNFTESVSDYLASDGWSLHYALINATKKIQLDSVASGDSHLFNYETAAQETWTIGSYTYQKYVKKAGASTVLIKKGSRTIEPFFETTDTHDGRTFARKMLDGIEALLVDRSIELDLEYSFNGKSMKSMTFAELIDARNHFSREVQHEETQAKLDAGEEAGGRLFIGFG